MNRGPAGRGAVLQGSGNELGMEPRSSFPWEGASSTLAWVLLAAVAVLSNSGSYNFREARGGATIPVDKWGNSGAMRCFPSPGHSRPHHGNQAAEKRGCLLLAIERIKQQQ